MLEPGWMMTRSGKIVYPLDFKEKDVDIDDIAHHLAAQCRYAGATSRHYSVAEHAVIVSRYVPYHCRREALLHDASEAYLQDILKALKHSGLMQPYIDLEHKVEAVIYRQFGIISSPETRAAIKAVDNRIVMDETRTFMADHLPFWEPRLPQRPLDAVIVGFNPHDAKTMFLGRYRQLFG